MLLCRVSVRAAMFLASNALNGRVISELNGLFAPQAAIFDRYHVNTATNGNIVFLHAAYA
jgi:hypothetical protein